MAPGIDIRRDILAHMDFQPIIHDPQPMDPSIFAFGQMGLRDRLAEGPFEGRFSYDPKLKMLFIDLRQLAIKSERDVERLRAEVERRVKPLGHGVYAIVNYRGCRIDPGARESYRRMIAELEANCYLGVTRYGMSGKLGPVWGDDDWMGCLLPRRHRGRALARRAHRRSAAVVRQGSVALREARAAPAAGACMFRSPRRDSDQVPRPACALSAAGLQ